MGTDKTLNSAVEMARKSIYDNAHYLGKWKGFEVYEPVFEDDEIHYIGNPEFILAKNGTIRWTAGMEESFAIIDKFQEKLEDDTDFVE